MLKDISFLIIIPTYNSFNDLGRLKNSLIKQTFQDWKVIFIDASRSSNEHKKWLNNCSKSDPRFFVTEENLQYQGIFPSMSYGLEFASRDDWILFVGSDDWFTSPKSLESVAIEISKSTKHNLDLLISQTKFVDRDKGKTLRVNKVPNIKYADKIILSRLMFFGYMPIHQSACFSYKVLSQTLPYANNYYLAADSDLFLRLLHLRNFNLLFIDKTFINIQSGGISHKRLFRRVKEVILIYFDFYSYIFFIPFLFRYLRKILSRLRFII